MSAYTPRRHNAAERNMIANARRPSTGYGVRCYGRACIEVMPTAVSRPGPHKVYCAERALRCGFEVIGVDHEGFVQLQHRSQVNRSGRFSLASGEVRLASKRGATRLCERPAVGQLRPRIGRLFNSETSALIQSARERPDMPVSENRL
jgi:hypothetical protein